MRKVVVDTFISLDGVVQGPGDPTEDQEGGFTQGGWVVPHFDDQLGAYMVTLTERAGALLLGRKTYDIFAASWPFMPEGDPVATVFNRIPKYVASRSRPELTWAGSHLLGEDIAAEVTRLKAEGDGEIRVAGSGDFVQTLLAHDLVDEFQLIIFPSIIGSGKRLFGSGAIPRGLALTSTWTTATGVTVLVYERVGDLQTANFDAEEFPDNYRENA